jgi:hypothetical protein
MADDGGLEGDHGPKSVRKSAGAGKGSVCGEEEAPILVERHLHFGGDHQPLGIRLCGVMVGVGKE